MRHVPGGFKDDLDEKASRVSEIGNALIKKILRNSSVQASSGHFTDTKNTRH